MELTLKKRTNEAADARRQPEERIRTKAGRQPDETVKRKKDCVERHVRPRGLCRDIGTWSSNISSLSYPYWVWDGERWV